MGRKRRREGDGSRKEGHEIVVYIGRQMGERCEKGRGRREKGEECEGKKEEKGVNMERETEEKRKGKGNGRTGKEGTE